MDVGLGSFAEVRPHMQSLTWNLPTEPIKERVVFVHHAHSGHFRRVLRVREHCRNSGQSIDPAVTVAIRINGEGA